VDRVWAKNYPEGVPTDINADHYASLLEVFDESIKDYAEKTAYINMGKSITYAELDQLSLKFAAYLQQIRPEKR
jgi:long-chain acyl-CoA synthetase